MAHKLWAWTLSSPVHYFVASISKRTPRDPKHPETPVPVIDYIHRSIIRPGTFPENPVAFPAYRRISYHLEIKFLDMYVESTPYVDNLQFF